MQYKQRGWKWFFILTMATLLPPLMNVVGAATDGHPRTSVHSQKHALGAWLQDFSKENQQLTLIPFADSLRQGPCVRFCLKGLQHVSMFFVSVLL